MTSKTTPEVFFDILNKLHQQYLPSKHSFFKQLAAFPHERLRSPTLLGQLHLRYQAACHATRVMIYHLPYLDSPALRVRKLGIINDDDNLINDDTHHYQLSRAFAHMGASFVIQDEDFGALTQLEKILDPTTVSFVSLVRELYPKSLGPWCIVETFAHDWMEALMHSLSGCFPTIQNEPYFAECFDQGIEEHHAKESLDLIKIALTNFPESLTETINSAEMMAIELDKFWTGLENLLEENQ